MRYAAEMKEITLKNATEKELFINKNRELILNDIDSAMFIAAKSGKDHIFYKTKFDFQEIIGCNISYRNNALKELVDSIINFLQEYDYNVKKGYKSINDDLRKICAIHFDLKISW